MNDDSRTTSRRRILTTTAAVAGATLTGGMGFVRPAMAQADDSAMISQIAKFKLNMEKEDAALEAVRTLVAGVESEEPGVLAYIAHRSTKDPSELVFFEIYADADALRAHGATPHIAELRKVFGDLFLPPFDVQRIDRVAGFAR